MTRLIKKYKNRRLYDTETSRYIRVEDLQRYVIDGIEFRVEDSTTAKDLSNATLLQIVVEMESGATQFLSTDMLRQLIVLAQHPMNKSFKEMLGQWFQGMEKSLKTNPLVKDYQKTADFWNEQTQQLMKQWQELFKI
ncbi:MAG: polyhydroxyalkanoate biosynthesis repressor PhaR [Tatlockia sp.]|nr:polyhydroxyalkanoate biosynthesis repressor PhaR [Tatlockia sp.]